MKDHGLTALPRPHRSFLVLAVVLLGAAAGWLLVTESSVPAFGEQGQVGAIALTDFNGEAFTLGDYAGKPLVVNFWASWCPSCTAEMPAFEHVYQRLEPQVGFVGINQSDSRAAAQELARSTGVTYRLAHDEGGEAFAAFGGRGMPTTVLIDERGDVVEIVAGGLSEEQLVSLIEEHLGVRG